MKERGRVWGDMKGVIKGVTPEGAVGKAGDDVDIFGVENAAEYRPGGYHPVASGDILAGR